MHLVGSDSELVRQCRDKRKTASLFAGLSIPSPRILDPLNLEFPCFMKPVGGSCSQGVKAIPSVDYLAPVDILNPSNLFQELVLTTGLSTQLISTIRSLVFCFVVFLGSV